MTEENDEKKPVFRILLEKSMNRELEELKKSSGVTIAEHMRRATRFYLLFRDDSGEISESELMRFYVDWSHKQKRKNKITDK